MRVWIACGEAPYRLPIAMADTATQLSKLTGEDVKNIRSTAYKVRCGTFKSGKFEMVDIDDED